MARARVRVLVLDCCFSGQALGWQSAAAVVDEAAAAAGKIVDTDLRGMYVLTSTEATEMGRYVVGEPHTAFTDALLAAIRASDDGTGREVRLGELYASTRQTLQRRQLPLPDADRMTPAAISSSGAAGLWTATSLPTRERRPSRLPARACCAARRRSGSCVSGDRRARPAQPKPGQRNLGCAEHSAGRAVHPGEQRCLLRRLLRSYPRPGEVVGARSVGHRWAERRTAEVCRATGSRVNTSLEPVTLTRAFEQMTFDVTIPQYAKAGPGGVALISQPAQRLAAVACVRSQPGRSDDLPIDPREGQVHQRCLRGLRRADGLCGSQGRSQRGGTGEAGPHQRSPAVLRAQHAGGGDSGRSGLVDGLPVCHLGRRHRIVGHRSGQHRLPVTNAPTPGGRGSTPVADLDRGVGRVRTGRPSG